MGKYITINQFCENMGITRMTYYTWVKEGLPYFQQGRIIRLEEKEVMQWVENRKKRGVMDDR